MRRLWTTFWQLSKTERSGYLLLLALMAAYMGLSWWAPQQPDPRIILLSPPHALSPDSADLAQGIAESRDTSAFYFDINELDEAGLRRLGLRERSIAGLLRFRSKGGRVRNLAEFDRLFSLTNAEKERLRPWLLFPEKSVSKAVDSSMAADSEPAENKSKVFVQMDINSADSLALLELPGIGPAFAGRIVRYRERLGGFVGLEQLAEVYGVDSARYAALAPLLKTNKVVVRKIDPLTATETDLANHPYIGKVVARRWVAFREQRKASFTCDDLALLHGLDAQRLEKLRPYLACQGLQ